MTRKFSVTATSVLLFATLAGGIVGGRVRGVRTLGPATPSNERISSDYKEAVSIVAGSYAGEIEYERANQAAIQGMLSALDPHSAFFPRAEYKRLKEDQSSQFVGIGVTILQHRNGVHIHSVIEGTPAARAGLKYGDRILEVDGKDASNWSSAEVSRNVRGVLGEPVQLKIERAGEQAPLYFTIVRHSVPQPSITDYFMIRPGVGYVGLTRGFQRTTDSELREAIEELQKQGMKQMILDLRNNPGGLLEEAIDVASEFIPRGETIVSVRGREYKKPTVYTSKGNDWDNYPLVVLINRNSASASEIVAGAIQDHGRGLIVGQRSFGKALVQRVIPLLYGNGLTLTTGKFCTPYGRSIQRDFTNGSFYDYYARRDEESEEAERPAPSPSPAATPRPTGPAVTTAAGRVYYGGGGIAPDIEIRPATGSARRSRIAEAAFQFTRLLVAGEIAGLENYRVERAESRKTLRPPELVVADRVAEAFKEFIRREPRPGLQAANLDEESEFVRLRLRFEILTASYSSDVANRALLEGDLQMLKAIESLPEAKRLAEAFRNSAIRS